MSKFNTSYSKLYIDTTLKNYEPIDSSGKYSILNQPQISNNSAKYFSIPYSLTIKTPINSNSMKHPYILNDPSINSQINLTNKLQNEQTKANYDIQTENKSQSNNTPINYVDINDLLGNENKKSITLDLLNFQAENYEQSKTSSKNMGIVKAYGVNTYQGIVRNYNEDRVSIIINMNKPNGFNNQAKWPKVSFFGVYDGHGGFSCAEFLRDNLHKYIIQDSNFILNVPEAIKRGFALAEKDFLENYATSKKEVNTVFDRSGSCAVILLIVDNKCYIANVGDSRAIMSASNGNNLIEITTDHKPNNPNEKNRIISQGGKVYQSQTPLSNALNQVLFGPFRVLPGRLSVSRTFGDVEAKKEIFGGLPNVIIAVPDIYVYEIEQEDIDFFILGCDGIYDQMSNKDVFDCAWMVFNQPSTSNEYKESGKSLIHIKCGKAVDLVLKSAMARKSFDNVTCLIIAMKDLCNNINNNKLGKPLIENCSYNNFIEQKSNKEIIEENVEEKEKAKNKREFEFNKDIEIEKFYTNTPNTTNEHYMPNVSNPPIVAEKQNLKKVISSSRGIFSINKNTSHKFFTPTSLTKYPFNKFNNDSNTFSVPNFISLINKNANDAGMVKKKKELKLSPNTSAFEVEDTSFGIYQSKPPENRNNTEKAEHLNQYLIPKNEIFHSQRYNSLTRYNNMVSQNNMINIKNVRSNIKYNY